PPFQPHPHLCSELALHPRPFRYRHSSSPLHRALPELHSFPTRRSSDLERLGPRHRDRLPRGHLERAHQGRLLLHRRPRLPAGRRDRKSTRLNSSHVKISYAVFCLKNKTGKTIQKARTHLTAASLVDAAT